MKLWAFRNYFKFWWGFLSFLKFVFTSYSTNYYIDGERKKYNYTVFNMNNTALNWIIQRFLEPQVLCNRVCNFFCLHWCFPFLLDPWAKLFLNKMKLHQQLLSPFSFVYTGNSEAKHYLLILIAISRWTFLLLLLLF